MPTPTSTSAQIQMSSKSTDLYDVVIPEGWEFSRYGYPSNPAFTAELIGDPAPSARVFLESFRGLQVGGSRASEISPEEVLEFYLSKYFDKGSMDLVVLPEREIGGERAVGLRVWSQKEGHSWVHEEWFVVRHDGVWRFGLSSGTSRDVIGQDAYAILDSFRWTGPQLPELPVEESEN
ncbi:hypothetical protein EII34_06400 [Arachnia propionica]|uniref:Uncharacterized protein n=1 Tax=Arachnia propionica TaxID=1750 RepID=A0A3P1T780_9ACTN|nr:hypothetical protein [Arachnia propionica]MDO5083541.1 hypothetical protein [Arachnia propionica]RRD05361.1 hypothetical protein EII34_06400 [Arachnia propionica]